MSSPERTPDPDDYAVGVLSPWGSGMAVSATGGDRNANPHLVDTDDWREWLRGFEDWIAAPKFTLEIPDA